MFTVDIETTTGTVGVQTTENKGLSPEYWTDRIVERLVSISDTADPMVKAQAEAFRAVSYTHLTLPTTTLV